MANILKANLFSTDKKFNALIVTPEHERKVKQISTSDIPTLLGEDFKATYLDGFLAFYQNDSMSTPYYKVNNTPTHYLIHDDGITFMFGNIIICAFDEVKAKGNTANFILKPLRKSQVSHLLKALDCKTEISNEKTLHEELQTFVFSCFFKDKTIHLLLNKYYERDFYGDISYQIINCALEKKE